MGTYTDQDFRELKELVEENNKILKRLNRRANFSTIYSIIRWVLIIGIAIGAFTLIQPFFDRIAETYKSVTEGVASINEAKEKVGDLNLPEFISLIKNQN